MTEATPPLPYTVESLTYGGHLMPTRKLPGGGYGPVLSPDEIAVWAHLEAVTAERDRFRAELERLRPTVEPDARPTKKAK